MVWGLRRRPRGVGLYDRGNPGIYPGDSAAALAARYGCRWLAVATHNGSRPIASRAETAADARRRGLDVWAWSYPGAWLPWTWAAGLSDLRAAAREFSPRGVIVDVENWDDWSGERFELERFARALERLARSIPVGVTTFPSWGGRRTLSRLAPSIAWWQPQCYGVRSGASPSQTVAWADAWRRDMPRETIVPALAAWDYDAGEARRYYRAWRRRYAAYSLWTARRPWTDAAHVSAVRSIRTRPSTAAVGGAVACAAAAAAAVWGR